MGLFSDLFTPKEIKLCLLNLEYILQEIKDNENLWAINYIKEKCKIIIKQLSSQLVEEIRKNNTSPKILIIRIIFNLTETKLRTGDFHFYRGELNEKGKEIHNVLLKCLDLLFLNKEFDEKELKKIKKTIKEIIKENG